MKYIPTRKHKRNRRAMPEQSTTRSLRDRLRRRSTEDVARFVRGAHPWRIDLERVAENVPAHDPEFTATVYGEWHLKRWELACSALRDLAVRGDIVITRDGDGELCLVGRPEDRGPWPEGASVRNSRKPRRRP